MVTVSACTKRNQPTFTLSANPGKIARRRGRPCLSYRDKIRENLRSILDHEALPEKSKTQTDREKELKLIIGFAKNKELSKNVVVPHTREPDQL